MAKEFDLVEYFLEKYNIQGEIIDDIDDVYSLERQLEMNYNGDESVEFDMGCIREGELVFTYYIVKEKDKIFINPCRITIPSIDDIVDIEEIYYIDCYSIRREINKDEFGTKDYDVIVLLDSKVILIEKWWNDPCDICNVKVFELGTLTDAQRKRMPVLGLKLETVITDPEKQEIVKRLFEYNKTASPEE